jgi:hypothetical protein
MSSRTLVSLVVICIAAAAASVTPAQGSINLGFYGITNNDSTNTSIGENQLSVTVSEVAGGKAEFLFSNSGPEASSITDVYFDDGTLLSIASIDDSDPGVAFSQYAWPTNLPGANNISPPFQTTAGFSADSDYPVEANGVGPGESLGIVFNLQLGRTFTDVLQDLATGALRIGLQVQGFDCSCGHCCCCCEPESFVNSLYAPPSNVVPEPSTLAIWSLLAGAVVAAAWQRRRATAN